MLLENIRNSLWSVQCDCCGKVFKRRFAATVLTKSKTHGCSRICGSRASRKTVVHNLQEKHGVINVSQLSYVRKKVEQTSLERYGSMCPFQAESVKAKIVETNIQRYGMVQNYHHPDAKAKRETTNKAKYGSISPMGCTQVRRQRARTMVERYGVEHPLQNETILAKTQATNTDRYGFSNPLMSPEIRMASEEKHLQLHGVRHSAQRPDVIAKIRESNLAKYGVSSPMKLEVVQKKMLASMLNRGAGFVSRDELVLKNILENLFGKAGIQHQVHVNGWLIDFFIEPVCAWLQLDGVYWHGLSRSEHLLHNPITARDKDITRKWYRDREQEVWFRENNMTLVRVTDKELQHWCAEGSSEAKLTSLLKNEAL